MTYVKHTRLDNSLIAYKQCPQMCSNSDSLYKNMDVESDNWCRLAQTLMHKGADVCRQFIQLEILTIIFTKVSRYWMDNIHNPGDINYLSVGWNKLNGILKRSKTPSNKILDELLQSWTTTRGSTLMEQIKSFQQWKKDIDKNVLGSSSSSIDDTLHSWLSQIEHEIQELNSICTVLRRWNNTFHGHLQNAQSDLLLAIEKNDEFLSNCSQKLKSLSEPSCSELQQLVQTLKQQLKLWKTKCFDVLHGFSSECRNLISVGLREAQDIPKSDAIIIFLNEFKIKLICEDIQADVDLYCDKWDDNLHNILDRCEKQTQEVTSTEETLSLAQSLYKKLGEASFKEKKIRDFFSSFIPPVFPKILEQHRSKLKDISGSSDLNKIDLTLLISIWINGNFVHSPLPGQEEDPHDWDESISADILRLREYRYNIVAHISELRIPSDMFQTLWKQLADLLLKIASRYNGGIDQIESILLEPYNEYKLRKDFLTWCKNDILAQLSAGSASGCQCLDMLQFIQTALDKLFRSRQACTCRICNKEYSTESEFVQHMSIHRAHSCRCKETFSTEDELINHGRYHQGLTCRMCSMPCPTEYEFRRHMWCNQDCKCLRCEDKFLTESTFEEHIMIYHQVRTCGICNTDCFTESEFCQHMLCHQVHSCLNCDEDFSTGNELEQHMMCHEARMCRSCDKALLTGLELEEHMKDHQARTCSNCNEEFSTESGLAEHVMNEEGCRKGIP